MAASESVEARLRDIEARCAAAKNRSGKSYVQRENDRYSLIENAPGDLAWLVALVRRYRAALEWIGPDDEPMDDDGYCLHAAGCFGKRGKHTESCPWRIAREARNEEVPP